MQSNSNSCSAGGTSQVAPSTGQHGGQTPDVVAAGSTGMGALITKQAVLGVSVTEGMVQGACAG